MKRLGIFSKALSAYSSRINQLPVRQAHHKPTEVSIKVPWGHISGLHWNKSTSATPFICVHGWKENAATFSRLIPTILDSSKDYQFVAIDLPGHGFSSHYPQGMLYQLTDQLLNIQRVFAHFGWSEKDGIHLMGHSLGAILSFVLAASHPNLVDCVVAIDALVPIMFCPADMISLLSITTGGVLKLESISNSSPVTLPYEEIRQRFLESQMGVDEDSCDAILTRAVVETTPNSGEWKLSHDPRVHFLPLMVISQDQIEYFAKAFRSKLLFIKAECGVDYMSKYTDANVKKWLTENNKQKLEYVFAENSSHHVHLNEPEKIAPSILKFLKETH